MAAKKRGRPVGSKNKKTTKNTKQKRNRQVKGVVLFIIGLFTMALTFIRGDNVWLWIHEALFGIFGVTTVIVSLILLYIAFLESSELEPRKIRIRIFELIVCYFMLSMAVELFFFKNTISLNFLEGIKAAYAAGVKGGGAFAALGTYPLLKVLGDLGSKITVVLLFVGTLLIITKVTVSQIYSAAKKPAEKTVQMSKDLASRYSEGKADRKQNIDEFDIPIYPDDGDDSQQKDTKFKVKNAPLWGNKGTYKFKEQDDVGYEPYSESQTDETGYDPKLPVDESVGFEPYPDLDEFGGFDSDVITMKQFNDTDVKEDIKKGVESIRGESLVKRSKMSVIPPVELLTKPPVRRSTGIDNELKSTAKKLESVLESFGVRVKTIDMKRGPAVTRYELKPLAGVKISKITGLADDIALNLAASGVRIEAPIPNKAAVGIEVPNKKISMVYVRELIESLEYKKAKGNLSIALGKDIAGENIIADIEKMPHLLIAGATGSGKSVCINSIVLSILYKCDPSDVKMVMIDPKVVELGGYNKIPHLLVPVVTDPRKAAGALGWAVNEMTKRYKQFADTGVRDLEGYNKYALKNKMEKLPQIVIIIDELADLMMAAPNEVEDYICRLAQMARAAGMHLVIATQRPSVNVITGVIKANIPSRIAFSVSSSIDSRTILDGSGAEKLLGRGDMLYYPVSAQKPVRIQGCYVDQAEVDRVVSYISDMAKSDYHEDVANEIEKQTEINENKSSRSRSSDGDKDKLFFDAAQVVVDHGQASTSFLQRKLKVGYARAARIVDELEESGIVGSYEGSKPRQVLITRQQLIEMKTGGKNE